MGRGRVTPVQFAYFLAVISFWKNASSHAYILITLDGLQFSINLLYNKMLVYPFLATRSLGVKN